MLIAERFLSNLVIQYGKHPVSTDGGTCTQWLVDFPETKTPYSFLIREKSYRMNNAIYQRHNIKFR